MKALEATQQARLVKRRSKLSVTLIAVLPILAALAGAALAAIQHGVL